MKRVLVLLLTLIQPYYATIIEIKNINELLNYLTPSALIICDIDNTIVESAHPEQLGGDQWFNAYHHYLLQQGINPEKAFHDALCQYFHHQLELAFQCAEHSTADIINRLKLDYMVLGLTARSMVLMQKTVDNLASLGIGFSSGLHHRGFMVDMHHPAFFYEGIIFCSGYGKGPVLKRFLEITGLRPSTIIMIDDKRSYLESVEAICRVAGIEFIGLRYGYLDEKVASYQLT